MASGHRAYKGGLILAFGAAIVIETAFKIAGDIAPSSRTMLVVTAIALAANLGCLALLWRCGRLDVNMASTFECSRNDVIANPGVLVAAGLVAWSGSGWPDIAAGLIIAILFLRSAARVLRRAWPVWRGRGDIVALSRATAGSSIRRRVS